MIAGWMDRWMDGAFLIINLYIKNSLSLKLHGEYTDIRYDPCYKHNTNMY